MQLIICYDITDPKRLRRVERIVSGFAFRLQDSLFEGEFSTAEIQDLREKLAAVIDRQCDSVRYYPVCSRDLRNRVRIERRDERVCGSGWVI